MSPLKIKVLLIITLFQLVVVLALGIKIYNQQKQEVLGVSANPIPQKTLLFPKDTDYKYFFEPQPNTNQEINLSWMGLNYSITNNINADGLNQLKNYPATKSAGTYRIITIGDSFTYGENVNTQENYPSQLENLLNTKMQCKNIKKIEVLNLGVGGYDVPYAVERYKLKGQKYNPNLVLWLFIGDDLYRADEELLPLSQKLEAQEKATGEYQKLVKQGVYYQAWTDAENQIINQAGGKDAMLKLALKNLNTFNQFYKGPLVTLTFSLVDNGVKNTLREFASERKDTYYYGNLPNIYTQPNLYLPDKHPSAQGYTVIANNLYDYLTKNNIIPCQKP